MTDAASPEAVRDIRPVVGRKVSNRSLWIFGMILAVGGGALFAALSMQRTAMTSPTIFTPTEPHGNLIVPPPTLEIPPAVEDQRNRNRPVALISSERSQSRVNAQLAPLPRNTQPRSSNVQPEPEPSSAASPPPDPAYVYQAAVRARSPAEPAGEAGASDQRAHASRFKNPSTSVPQGTVIQAVLETALNSNHPGFARAVVSHDVSSFDGSRVLIPKGSKIFGEYKADINLGQDRALIRWHRLTRPDGVIIDVDSPTADPLGRAGVEGDVDTHFFARFGGSILQSVLDVGVQLAARKATGDTIIVGAPGSSQSVSVQQPQQIRPTIKVKQGTSVSVFVMRDLDFTDVEL